MRYSLTYRLELINPATECGDKQSLGMPGSIPQRLGLGDTASPWH